MCLSVFQLVPEYETAAQTLASYGVVLAKVDATVHADLAKTYNISGFPAFKVGILTH